MSTSRTTIAQPPKPLPVLTQKTICSIKEAIEANLSLQGEIIKKLQLISKAKRKNRKRSLQLTDALLRHMNTNVNTNDEEQKHSNTNSINEGDDNNNNGTDGRFKSQSKPKPKSKSKKRKTNAGGAMARLWHENTDRKWKRRFFIDPDGSIPDSNPDETQRRKWEGMILTTHAHRFLPWSKDELKLLEKNAEEVRREQLEEEIQTRRRRRQEQTQNGNGSGNENENENETSEIAMGVHVHDRDIDFHKVAEKMAVDLRAKKYTQNQKTRNASHCYSQMQSSNIDTAEPRTWVDYRVKFLTTVSPSINKRPFTKAESLKIIEALHKHNGNPPWHIVAHDLHTSRTPFQCFQHAQIKLSNSMAVGGLAGTKTQVFNQDEDELLFKFIAASGPQFVLDQHSATLMAQRFFPHASADQITHRANVSLVNPRFVMERWNEREERMLVMAMKVYSESETPLAKAGGLFTHRSFKSVSDKWNRCLNPCYSTQPFTVREDKALLAAAKEAKATVDNWKVVADQFPTRNPRSLMYRWVELARGEDVIKLQGTQLLQKGLRSIGRRKARSNATGGEDLDADDFVLRVKKKRKQVG